MQTSTASMQSRLQHSEILQFRRTHHIRRQRTCLICSCKQQRRLRDFQNMTQAYNNLAGRLLDASEYVPSDQKYIVGIAGVPGSGKSTTAKAVGSRINALRPRLDKHHVAVVVGMDGYHYTRQQLDEFDDPDEAHARRGAHWTFDGAAFVKKMQELQNKGEAMLPSFDHGVGDPVADGVSVISQNKIVLVEGNYLLLDVAPWNQLVNIFNETWFVDCDVDIAMERVYERQVGHGRPPEVARWRVENNDRKNALQIAETAKRADLLVPSLPETCM